VLGIPVVDYAPVSLGMQHAVSSVARLMHPELHTTLREVTYPGELLNITGEENWDRGGGWLVM
jgi:hypothetical protein